MPKGIIRPAMDRMRESIFGILGDLTGYSFLDLFSGSGIIALEAASRGADPVEAVEMDPLKRSTILKNVSMAPQRIHCHFMSAELYIKRGKQPFDFIFCDPPFPYKFKQALITSLGDSLLMKTGSLLLLHRPREEILNNCPRSMDLVDRREYGRSIVDFYKYIS